MDKIWQNKWAVRLISLLFAIVIYSLVTNENRLRNNAMNSQIATSVNSSETLYNVPLYLGPHPDDLYVSDLQEKVTVKLEGPRNILNQVTQESFVVQTESISREDIGTTTLALTIKGLPNEINYRIIPGRVKVSVKQREVVTLPVQYKLDGLQVEDGYQVASVEMDPKEVKLTGSKEMIEAIDFVGINISSDQPVKETFSDVYRIQILDKQGELLDVNTETSDIKVKVEVVEHSKELPLKLVALGEDNTKYTYSYAFLDQESVTLYGSEAVLNALEAVEVVVDVSNIQSSQEIVGMLNLPSGISNASTNQVPIKVKIEAIDTTTTAEVNSTVELDKQDETQDQE